MSKETPDRVTFSIPDEHALSAEEIETAADESGAESVSEYIRNAVLDDLDPDE